MKDFCSRTWNKAKTYGSKAVHVAVECGKSAKAWIVGGVATVGSLLAGGVAHAQADVVTDTASAMLTSFSAEIAKPLTAMVTIAVVIGFIGFAIRMARRAGKGG